VLAARQLVQSIAAAPVSPVVPEAVTVAVFLRTHKQNSLSAE